MLAVCCLAAMMASPQEVADQSAKSEDVLAPLPHVYGWQAAFYSHRNGLKDLPTSKFTYRDNTSPIGYGNRVEFGDSVSDDNASLTVEMHSSGDDVTIHLFGKVNIDKPKGSTLTESTLEPSASFEIYTIGKPLSIQGAAKVRGTLTADATSKGGNTTSRSFTSRGQDRDAGATQSAPAPHDGTYANQPRVPSQQISEDTVYNWKPGSSGQPAKDNGFGPDIDMGMITVKGDRYDNTIGFRLPHLIADVETSGGGTAEATFDVTAQVHLVVKGAPALNASFDMADNVQKNGGTLPFGFRDAYFNRYSKNQDGDGLWFSGNAENGAHAYLAVHSLGKSKMSPAEAMAICRSRIGMIFPGGAVDVASPKTGAVVIKGHQYKLMGLFFKTLLHLATEAGIIGKAVSVGLAATETVPPVVRCTESDNLHFTFWAEPNHPLVGTALHGVFKDSTGELWMYQQGRGEKDELAPRLAYFAAHNLEMWRAMANNLRRAIGN